jgi:hypothetical protein
VHCRSEFREINFNSIDIMKFGWLILDVSIVNTKPTDGIIFRALD